MGTVGFVELARSMSDTDVRASLRCGVIHVRPANTTRARTSPLCTMSVWSGRERAVRSGRKGVDSGNRRRFMS